MDSARARDAVFSADGKSSRRNVHADDAFDPEAFGRQYESTDTTAELQNWFLREASIFADKSKVGLNLLVQIIGRGVKII